MERISRDESKRIVQSFEDKYGAHFNFNQVCMRFNAYDGSYLEVKVKDIFAEMVGALPQIFEGCNVFVEEAPAVRIPLPQD